MGLGLGFGAAICGTLIPAVATADGNLSQLGRPRAGAVAADHELASQAGAEVLEKGGNAVDAAVATALALGVVQPSGSGLGGGGFLVYRRADGQVSALDFREVAPKAATADMFVDPKTGQVVPERSRIGGLAVGVPGEAAGFALALREQGRLGAKPGGAVQVIAPALRLAREGFPVGKHLAQAAALTVAKLKNGEPVKTLLAPGGVALKAGEVWRRPELATTLETLGREGFPAFYRTTAGGIGAEIVHAVEEAGGVLSAADLAAYKPLKRKPLEGRYRGWRLISAPPPAGGVTAIEALQILNARPPLREGAGASSTFHEIIEAFKHAFADRARFHGDPAFDKVPFDELVSPAYAAARAAQLRAEGVLPADQYGRKTTAEKPAAAPRDHGTAHICVIDKDGNAAAMTTTVNLYFGARLAAGKTGILLNNQMDDFAAAPNRPNAFGLVGIGANAIAPGKRPASSMAPIIAVAPDGSVLCIGGSGGPTIVTGVVQTIVNVVDFKLPIAAAVAAPRIHAQFVPDDIEVEPGVPADVRTALTQRGHKLNVRKTAIETGVEAVLWKKRAPAPFTAASDPRKGGEPALP